MLICFKAFLPLFFSIFSPQNHFTVDNWPIDGLHCCININKKVNLVWIVIYFLLHQLNPWFDELMHQWVWMLLSYAIVDKDLDVSFSCVVNFHIIVALYPDRFIQVYTSRIDEMCCVKNTNVICIEFMDRSGFHTMLNFLTMLIQVRLPS